MSRNISPKELAWWHQRYLQQADWTKGLRYHLYRRLEIARCDRILELGCGTGVIANELAERTGCAVFGLDSNPAALGFARERASKNKMPICLAGDAEKLPFGDGSLDLIITHYFWLWTRRPGAVLDECRRVLKKGGTLAALAEPDYSKRIDQPDGHPAIKKFLSDDLKKIWADPDVGGKLKDIFSRAEFKWEMGSMNGQAAFLAGPDIFLQEWAQLEKLGYPHQALRALREDSGDRWMTMPVHWAVGKKA